MPQKIKQHPEDKSKFVIEKKVNFWYDFDKTKPDLIELYQHTNKPVAVLGGGPSLPEDLKKIPKDCILISCNHHAFRLVEPDYMCFLDPVENNHSQVFKDICKDPKGAKRISYSNLDLTDYYCINEAQFHTSSDTGIFSSWVASYITSGNVYLCGFNLRDQSEPMHFYENPDTVTAWGGPSMDVKLERWRKLREGIERPERVKAVSGILKTVFV